MGFAAEDFGPKGKASDWGLVAKTGPMLASLMLACPRLTTLALALLAGLGCSDRLIEVADDEPETVPVCMVLAGTVGYWEDGSHMNVWDDVHEETFSICTCMTQEQLEARTFHDELNDQMLVECQRLSDLMGFDWDECIEDHAAGDWEGATFRATQDDYWAFLVPNDLDCE